MSGTQLENTLELIDASLLLNRDEVLRYIQSNPDKVREAADASGELRVPTSAGPVTINIRPFIAA